MLVLGDSSPLGAPISLEPISTLQDSLLASRNAEPQIHQGSVWWVQPDSPPPLK